MRTCIAVALGIALAAAGSASGASPIAFHTPSKNIDCLYLPRFLRCDIRSGLRPVPKRACELDWTGVSLSQTGRGRANCAGDSVADPRSTVLAYGRTWRRGGFVCRSRLTGLTCANASGRGFFLSRQRYRTF